MKPKVTIYAAGEIIGSEQRAGAVAVLLSGSQCKAIGAVQPRASDQEAQVTACRLGLAALNQPCEVDLQIALEVIAQMCSDPQSLAILSYTDWWMALRRLLERHEVRCRSVRRMESPRMAAVCFAARELALAGTVVEAILADVRDAVLTGRGLMSYSLPRRGATIQL